MSASTSQDTELARAWDQFCDQLKEAGKIPFREGVPAGDLSRVAGFRCLVQNIGLGVQFYLENDDPLHPELLHYFDPIRKQGGDNPDAVYVGGPINGTDTYRIHGNRGSAKYFAVTAVETGDTPWGGGVASTLFGQDMKVDEDGNFEIICSPEPHPGNWLKTTPNTFRVTFRQFFADWENERPMHAAIDRISPMVAPKPVMDADRLSKGLDAVSRWVGVSLNYWADMIEKWKAQPNRFLSYRQLDDNKIDATPGGEPLIMYWQLPADEAIVIRVKPPEAVYWAVEFGNYWWCSMDYRSILSNTNCHYALLEDDGELIVVVAHQDTGHANWLDPAGFSEGYVTIRWMQADHYPTPIATQLKLTELGNLLPQAKKLTQEERVEQIATRRRGVVQRFGI
ncbi:hypothetical protein IMCC3088_134 [Aequoribacter fuscus]|jgi:hypothetical protein|uniref:Uncharacterized protein n=1 Tax=Aequoribacter fuscus TaxID=2518989 RepID=F3L5H1_9GAMM|nr:DUF1214 domain-containing protein [Aequoribacter fuscus]EGG28425.1 hypothetical protein IMCC3088_134 [Aequoribacter fuscus]QHJ88331.1 DUF1214 domain-containing protein [Aequoribacter fuscus]